ncbi:MAG TPA: vWA domain-containing protein [Planctomycetota bacterium]|nr:vWA domain-containing protein [Planctomycetota bacterium]
MSEFWLRALGFDLSRIPRGAQTEFVWTHAPASWSVFVLLALVAGLVYLVYSLYRREMKTCRPGVKAFLAVVRIAVLLVLVVVFMGPALAISLRRTVEPYVVLLLDESLSMGIQDHYDAETSAKVAGAVGLSEETLRERAPSRAELVDALLGKDEGKFLKELRKRGRVRVMTFSDSLKVREALGLASEPVAETPEAAALARGEPVPPLVPSGASTDLARAVRESLASLAGSPVAGIVMVTDGQNTGGSDPLAAAELAAHQRVPLLPVGVGDPRNPQNLRVADVWAPETAFAGDPFQLQARLHAEGMGAAAVTAEFVERKAAGTEEAPAQETVLERKQVTFQGEPSAPLGAGPAQANVSFRHTPKVPGQFIYTVRVAPEPNELLKGDNERSITVRVVSEQARVLLIAGSPTWDFHPLRTLLIRDKTINVSCWLQSIDPDMQQDGDTVIEKLPDKPEELFKYDVLLFLDPDPLEFNEAWMEALRKFVGDHAGGLLWQAGPKYTVRFLTAHRTREVRTLLPVRLGDFTEADLRLLSETHTRPWPARVTAAGTDHPLLVFDKDPQVNAQIWEAMPGIYWSFPSHGVKPGTTTLLEHGDPRLRVKEEWRPLLVASQYGAGRCLYLGFNSTWRWRKLGERYFDQFWVQAVRYLVEGRLMGGKRRGRIETDRDLFTTGSRVPVAATLYTPAFEPLALPTVPLLVRGQPGTPPLEAELRLVPNRPGHYEGAFVVSQLGINEIEIALRDDPSGKPVLVTKQITVETPRVEFADPRLNRALLADMAERSKGRYFGMDEADQVASAIPDRRETIIVREKPQNLWDTTRLLGLLALLLTIEWAVRKYNRLM